MSLCVTGETSVLDLWHRCLEHDYVTHNFALKIPSRSKGTPYPIAHYINCDSFSANCCAFLASPTSTKESRSFKEAMRDEIWRRFMQEQINALEHNGTWTMEYLPPSKRALGSHRVFRNKYDSNNLLDWRKSRLVVMGNHQQECIDYIETFAPFAKMVTVCAFLAIVASKHWELH